jgi:hypothetical protein
LSFQRNTLETIMNETAVKTNPEIELPSLKGGAVTVIEQSSATLDSLMAKMATDPNCDVDKFERLVRLNIEVEKVRRDELLNVQFNEAMSRAQAKMVAIIKDKKNSQTSSKYASYAALDRAVRPIYTGEGFNLTFDEGETSKPDHVRVLCDASLGGFTKKYHVDMPADGKGAKGGDVMTKTHATGSAFTYGQRRLVILIFNLATIDDDDDGNRAGQNSAMINEKQVAAIQKMIVDTGADIPKFCEYMGVERIEEILAKHYNNAMAALRKKADKKGKPK